ncbi:MAG TPA: HYR domain-containing protein [Candidatus Polarisedimenticolia bacterium]|nr:HYR domain-containing protein [Candidatus Polarisedimenticolia bacterium]
MRVRPGTYVETVQIEKDVSLVSEAGPEVTTINGAGGLSTVTVGTLSDVKSVRALIRGFTIRNGGGSPNFTPNGYGVAVSGFGSTTARIENNVIRDNLVRGGIFIYPIDARTFDVTIDGNRIEHNGFDGGVNVDFRYFRDYRVSLRNNMIAFNTGPGVLMSPGPFEEVVNNTVYGNSAAYNFAGVVVPNMASVRVVNNILYGNTSGGGRDLNLYFVGGGGPVATPSFNIIGDGGFSGLNGNIAQDPLLVAPQAGDFHLDPRSPAIDTGDSSAARGDFDFEGDLRKSDGDGDGSIVVDRGADEFSTNDLPVAAIGQARDFECTGPGGAFVVLDGTPSSDLDSTPGTNDDIALFEWFEDYGTPSQHPLGAGETLQVFFSLAPHAVTLKVTDRAGKSDIDGATVAVVDTTPPFVECPAVPEAAECIEMGRAYVSLFANAYDLCGEVTLINDQSEIGADASGFYPVGVTTVTYTSTDEHGNASTCSLPVRVVDTVPPGLVLQTDPQTLWPPDRRLVPVAVHWVTQDTCDPGGVSVELVAATSSEPDTGRLKGYDIQGAEVGTPDDALALRAERNGQGAGRVYTLAYRAIDAAGNVTLAETTVTVPHDQQAPASETSAASPALRIRAGRARLPPPAPVAPDAHNP